jgi:hypothetical protein
VIVIGCLEALLECLRLATAEPTSTMVRQSLR